MMKFFSKCFVAALLLAVGLFAAESKNLLENFAEAKDGTLNGWVRNCAKVNGIFALDAATKTLSMTIKEEVKGGYIDWRYFTQLKPGDYTLTASFTAKEAGLNVNVYSFNDKGKPTLILTRSVTAPVNNTGLVGAFKVPADSVKIRLGFTIYKAGIEWKIINPAVVSGKATK